MTHFLGLPDELVLLCISLLDQSDISRLVRTCRHAQSLLTPTLYTIGYGTALPWAAKNNEKEMIGKVLEYCQPKGNELFRALTAAAQHGHVEIAELLLDHGAPTDLQPGDRQQPARFDTFAGKVTNQSPLLGATVGGYPSVISLLLARGARVDVADRHGYYPLHYACEQHEAPDCVSVLLAAGADVHACNKSGLTAVDLASGDGLYRRTPCNAILREVLLATRGSVLAFPSSGNGVSVARKLISNGDEDCKRMVLEFGMPLVPAISPSEILLAAAAIGDVPTVKQLLQVDDNDLDAEGTTDLAGNNALMLAAKHGHSAVFQIILQHIGNEVLSERNEDGQTVLHLAISSEKLDTVRTVADSLTGTPRVFNLRDRNGRTPLLHATECKTESLGVIRLLISNGININVIDISGSSPLHKAARHGHTETVRLFLDTLASLPHSHSPTIILKPSAKLATTWGCTHRIPDDDQILATRQTPLQPQPSGMFDFGARLIRATYPHVVTRQGPVINLVDDNGFTPLSLAADHREVAELLIGHEAVSLDEARRLEQNSWFTGQKKAAGYGY
ncbi:ankyrin repeat-containing domain protein [Aspergillus germanicus]